MRLRLPWKGSRPDPAPLDRSGLEEAKNAERAAQDQLRQAQRRTHEVNRELRKLHDMSRTNHFRERLIEAVREGYKANGHEGGA